MNGNLIESKKYYSKALRISFDANSIPIVLDTLVGLAHIYAQTDEPERAFELSYYILGNPSSTQETKDQASEIVLKTEKLLTTHQVQAIKEGLLNSSLEDIVRNNSGTTRWSTSS